MPPVPEKQTHVDPGAVPFDKGLLVHSRVHPRVPGRISHPNPPGRGFWSERTIGTVSHQNLI